MERHEPTDELVVRRYGLDDEEEQLVQLSASKEQEEHVVLQLAQVPLLITKGKGHEVTHYPL